MIGQVYKIHSDFYYIKADKEALVECKIREVLKKQKQKIQVGDFVEYDDNFAIHTILDRKNSLIRPNVSNIDLCVVTSSLLEPKLDLIQLNRYLTYLKHCNIDTILCFNKEDLLNNPDFKKESKKIKEIYEPLGYKIIFTSAKENIGLKEFKKEIKDKTIVLCGLSGVGKSSIVNALNPELDLKIGAISAHNDRGTHTTRHCEIIELDGFRIVDTPGFSHLRFDFILPKDLCTLFEDMKKYSNDCRYSDCLHVIEEDEDCNVIFNLDKIEESRYESYLSFLQEAKEYKEKVTYQGSKKEDTDKITHGKKRAKISAIKRESSRNTQKQFVKNLYKDIEE